MQDPLEASIEVVHQKLRFTEQSSPSHQVTIIAGIEAPEVTKAIGHYLFEAGIVHSIRTNLSIARDLFGVDASSAAAFQAEVDRLLGTDNNISEVRRTTLRDPWIAEGIAHLLLFLSRRTPSLAPPGKILVLTQIHADVHSHGLDLVGIHIEGENLGFTVGEVKASDYNISAHVTATGALFEEIEKGLRDIDVRSNLQMLRDGLAPDQQKLITPGFWKARPAFFPILGHAHDADFDPAVNRPKFASLQCGMKRIRLLSIPLAEHKKFFDTIADCIRSEAKSMARAA